jgi:uncharacterized protein (DUF2249 family)
MEQQHIISIDVRPIPRPLRHGLIFNAFDALGSREALELVSDHDPRPLHYLFDVRYPDAFAWFYVGQGPSEWRVRIERR